MLSRDHGGAHGTGGAWQKIGEEISEKLDYRPSSLFVRRIVRPKYVVRFPDTDQPEELRIAELPPEALPKSKAAPGLVADVIVSKLVDHLPLYRQEQRYARGWFRFHSSRPENSSRSRPRTRERATKTALAEIPSRSPASRTDMSFKRLTA